MKITIINLKKIAAIMLVCSFLMTLGSITPSYAKESSSNSIVSISASFDEENNDNIIVRADLNAGCPWMEKVANTMNRTQIWGDYGKGWFLIKDYEISFSGNKFVWDLKSMDDRNESEVLRSYAAGNTDRLKLYVRYKRVLNDEIIELYKTFYLGNIKQDVQLTTNHEEQKYAPISYDFPIVAKQGSNIELYLDAITHPEEQYTVKIVGDNNYEETVEEKGSKNKKAFKWSPEKSGTFYIAVYDSKSQMILKRKVYVKSQDNKYLQLDDLSVQNENDTVSVRLSVAGTRPKDFDGDIKKSLQVVISEPYVWSRTIKDYNNDGIVYNEVYGAYELQEGRDGFSFGSGIYRIYAAIKPDYSIEPEDKISVHYKKSGLENINFKVKYDANRQPDGDGRYLFNSCEPLKFNFYVEEEQEGCEYAFFLEDARGKRRVKDYSPGTEFTWHPADPGEYKIYARIRQAGSEGNILQNSYEKEVCIPIRIGDLDKYINIRNVKIGGEKWTIQNGKVTNAPNNNQISARELNVVEIDAEREGPIFGVPIKWNRLMYKVCVVAKEHYYQVSPYTFSNYIPIYPKNTGEYRMIVMVKDSTSGSYEDYCEIKLNAK
ncbi:hypothetical protein [Petroclostridium sp. X23]|uniref:hypothetical protein n=1 Tax=Petroclostridium sp. X23 TaxID=3045146 RepID=UPI0024AC864C|nr:hypothetical protein [Petroclostridium sp. X23]WHH57516.1 hypothetical protein QKW49_16990 [Petroclostridium sp. X23]